MKILLASTSFKGGGISSYAHEVINNFSDGNDFHVIVGNEYNMPITKENVSVYHLDCENLSVSNLQKILSLINNDIIPDLILSNNAAAISILAPFVKNDIRIITLSHSLKYIEADKAAFTHKYVDTIIAASSQFNKDYLIKKFKIAKHDKIKVLYNFVTEYRDANHIREGKKNQTDNICIVFPGGGYPSKGPDIVARILKKLLKTDLKFKFYWMGNTHVFLSRLFPFLRVKTIQDIIPDDKRVVFSGRLPRREDVHEKYASANIFLTPSRREGCPMSLIEAMRVGTICIVSDNNNGNKEIIKDKTNGFVVGADDIEGFVDRIIDIINNNRYYSSFYDNSYITYKERLSYSVWKEKMNSIINDDTLSHKDRYGCLKMRQLRYLILRYNFLKLSNNIRRMLEESLIVFINLCRIKYYK